MHLVSVKLEFAVLILIEFQIKSDKNIGNDHFTDGE